jgi:NTP pyrophosphatase (non-canonical NTP hydrolase)
VRVDDGQVAAEKFLSATDSGEAGMSLGEDVARLSAWIDEHPPNAQRDVEAQLWSRVSKVGEEFGEVVAAMIGYTGQNPRKGYSHDRLDVINELADVAVTALAAIEHMTMNGGNSVSYLEKHVAKIVTRAGL